MRIPLCLLLTFLTFSVFSQTGITWSAEMDVATSNYSNQHPRIVMDASGNPLVIWGKFISQEVYFTRWNDTAFSSPVALNDSAHPVFVSSGAGSDITSHGDTVYVAVKQLPEDSGRIFLYRSFDGGQTFSLPLPVENISDSITKYPAVTTDSLGNPIVAFMKLEQGFINPSYVVTRSYDFGNTFNVNQVASMYTGSNVCDCSPGAIVSSGTNGAFLFRDDFNNFRTIWCGISNDNCETFPFGMPVDQTSWIVTACPLSGPDAIIIGDSVYTVFMSGASGDALCYLSAASVSGIWPGQTNPLTDSVTGLTNQNFPAIANYNNRVAVVCRQTFNGTGQLALFYTTDIASGLSNAFDTISWGNIANGDVAMTDSAIYVVWQDDNSETVKFRKGTFPTTSVSAMPVKKNDLLLYPSPVTGDFSIRLGDNTKIESVKIYSISGKEVPVTFNRNQSRIENRLSSGLYILTVLDKKSELHRTYFTVVN